MEKIDYTKVNPNDFTQKDLMLHLLQVSQHTVTREELKDDISSLDKKIDKLESNMNKRFEQVDKRFEQIDKRFEQVDKRFEQVDKRFDQLEKRIDKLDLKFDKLQWFIVVGALTILFKEQILALIGAH